MNNKILVVVILVVVFAGGYLAGGRAGGDSKTVIESQQKTISDLKSKIVALEYRALNETMSETVVEKPDGTKITTRNRETRVTEQREVAENRTETRTESAYSRTTNEIRRRLLGEFGVQETFDFRDFGRPETALYVQAGFPCLIFTCFGEISHSLTAGATVGSIGLKVSF